MNFLMFKKKKIRMSYFLRPISATKTKKLTYLIIIKEVIMIYLWRRRKSLFQHLT
jgi:hypothetical protein